MKSTLLKVVILFFSVSLAICLYAAYHAGYRIKIGRKGEVIYSPAGGWITSTSIDTATTIITTPPRPQFKPLAPPDDPPPAVVKVGPFFYRIEWGTIATLDDDLGQELPMTHKIRIAKNLSPDQYRLVLLHEIEHACAEIGQPEGSGLESEDTFIKTTTPTLLNVLQDNPELVAWLSRPKRST